jgi:catechol 2,3-dioxygenase-like lactoylglutathione lyase family enzyme
MIGYTCVGTNDLARATAFYDKLFALIGARHFFEMDRGIGWGTAPDQPMFCVMKPFDGQAATVGNGDMVALLARDAAQVDALHAKALALGAADEGAPGLRSDNFYGAYFRDLDGNKLAAYCMLPVSA